MKIITDFTELPMLYAKHFNRHAMLVCIRTPDMPYGEGALVCRAIPLAGSQYGELPFFGPQSFRVNGVQPEDVMPLLLSPTTIVIAYATEAWPVMVQYLGSETTHFVIPEPFQYQPEEAAMPTDVTDLEQRIAAMEARLDAAIPLHDFWDVPSDTHFFTANPAVVDNLKTHHHRRFYYDGVVGRLLPEPAADKEA